MKNAVTWFEIPVLNMDRAVAFYERALAVRLKRETFMGVPNALFPATRPPAGEGGPEGVGGALVHGQQRPSAEGTLVYLDVAGKLDEVLARVPEAGGTVVLPKTDIGAPGFIATIRDTEGNVVGLHTRR